MLRFFGADIVYNALTDPTTIITVGASKVGSIGAKAGMKAL